ncbi:MAG: hydroxyacylglutathione hydrolase [Pseudomonadales bacterium]|nr:hydroxyacylglutathione hydrolase [Pseudomonadales bacterium]
MHIHTLPALTDNYIWMIGVNHDALMVDPGVGEIALAALQTECLNLKAILITHSHHDHIGGIDMLLERYPDAQLFGPASVPHFQLKKVHHDEIIHPLPDMSFRVIATPGHTHDHLCYFQLDEQALFCGDALFSAGCGRLFEGNGEDLWVSMQRLRALPEVTRVFCAHEYTASNLRFVQDLWPENSHVVDYSQIVTKRRQSQQPTIPSMIDLEKSINPFLNWDHPQLIRRICEQNPGISTDPASILTALRQAKDRFR